MANILLMNLPVIIQSQRSCSPPLGLQYISSNIKEDNEVCILDNLLAHAKEVKIGDRNAFVGLRLEQVNAVVEQFNPDIIGVSCNFSYQHPYLVYLLNHIKTVFPDIKTIVGGNHVTACYKLNMPKFNVDSFVLGEGEEAFNLYLEGKLDKNKHYHIEDVNSLKFPNRNGMEYYYEMNLPHQTGFRTTAHNIKKKGDRVVTMLTSRGCPYNCIFCSVGTIWGRGIRTRSAENVLAEVDEVVNKYNANEIHLEDDNLLCNPNIKEIIKGLGKYKDKMQWTCPNGVDLSKIDEDLLWLMKENGCYRITICPESINDRILKFLRKPFNSATIREKMGLIRKVGFEMIGYFIIGAPDETLQEAWETIKFASNEFDEYSMSCLAPYPATDLWKLCVEKKILKDSVIEREFIDCQADLTDNIKRENLSAQTIVDLMNFSSAMKTKGVKL